MIRIGNTAKPEGLRSSDVEGADPAALAQAIDRLHTAATGTPTRAVVVAPSGAPEFAMPAAAWAAKAGDPVLWADRDSLPAATKAAIAAHRRPRIYVLGPPSVISDKVLEQLGGLGTARRISAPEPSPTRSRSRASPTGASAGTRSTPATASCSRPRSAPATPPRRLPSRAPAPTARCCSSPTPTRSRAAVQDYLLDIQPGYDKDPVRGVYNHGWVVGDESAISVDVQSRIDALLEIQPVEPGA